MKALPNFERFGFFSKDNVRLIFLPSRFLVSLTKRPARPAVVDQIASNIYGKAI